MLFDGLGLIEISLFSSLQDISDYTLIQVLKRAGSTITFLDNNLRSKICYITIFPPYRPLFLGIKVEKNYYFKN